MNTTENKWFVANDNGDIIGHDNGMKNKEETMGELYYSCGFGFHTFDLEEAKKYCLHKHFDLIHIMNNNLREIGCIFYDKKNHIWKEE